MADFRRMNHTAYEMTSLQAQAQVPKFGNWDDDNIPYTAFFDNARKGANAIINPNDPQDSPQAFTDQVGLSYGHNPVAVVRKSVSEYQSSDGRRMHRRNPSDKSNNMNITSESGSDHSQLQAAYRRERKKRSAAEEGLSASRQKSQTQSSDEKKQQHQRTISVPKFGAWDEADPTSGEGFTVIFNKVREEKQAASTNLIPPMPQQPTYATPPNQPPSPSKVCCCLFPRRRK